RRPPRRAKKRRRQPLRPEKRAPQRLPPPPKWRPHRRRPRQAKLRPRARVRQPPRVARVKLAVRAPSLRKPAETQQLSTETLPAQRGTITDRNGVDLAVSEPAQEISADPYLIKEPLRASQQLAPLLGLTETQLLGKLSEHTGFVLLAPALPARQARKLMAQVAALKFEGITGTPTMRRVYPRGTLASQLLGFVGSEGKGSSGLEYSQDALLQGV